MIHHVPKLVYTLTVKMNQTSLLQKAEPFHLLLLIIPDSSQLKRSAPEVVTRLFYDRHQLFTCEMAAPVAVHLEFVNQSLSPWLSYLRSGDLITGAQGFRCGWCKWSSALRWEMRRQNWSAWKASDSISVWGCGGRMCLEGTDNLRRPCDPSGIWGLTALQLLLVHVFHSNDIFLFDVSPTRHWNSSLKIQPEKLICLNLRSNGLW